MRRDVAVLSPRRGPGRLLAAAALSLWLGACDLVGPSKFDTYEMRAVNGAALPYVVAPLQHPDGKPYDLRYTGGTLTLFQGGRASLVLVQQRYLDGLPEPGGQQFIIRQVYTIAPGENGINKGWRTTVVPSTDTVLVSNYFDFDRFLFAFVRP